jgi:hypothetical protein
MSVNLPSGTRPGHSHRTGEPWTLLAQRRTRRGRIDIPNPFRGRDGSVDVGCLHVGCRMRDVGCERHAAFGRCCFIRHPRSDIRQRSCPKHERGRGRPSAACAMMVTADAGFATRLRCPRRVTHCPRPTRAHTAPFYRGTKVHECAHNDGVVRGPDRGEARTPPGDTKISQSRHPPPKVRAPCAHNDVVALPTGVRRCLVPKAPPPARTGLEPWGSRRFGGRWRVPGPHALPLSSYHSPAPGGTRSRECSGPGATRLCRGFFRHFHAHKVSR